MGADADLGGVLDARSGDLDLAAAGRGLGVGDEPLAYSE
jgi:hypothetical protein